MKKMGRNVFVSMLIVFLLTPVGLVDGQVKDLSEEIKALNARTDSMRIETEQIQARMDSNLKAQQRENFDDYLEQNQRNLNEFMAQRRAEEEKQKKGLWLRGGLLLIFLISAVYGWLKRRNGA